ncbi:hypothetical protein BV25DRAFT_1916414 [Artomyces pyxidatus]|uniref:Uncharacterized protein n=1 Tax=Artomyces pyxidatus TaxID=48021 RepID=A0ACB8T295_9AGAM|nr:hypothetical protein BV25DRAFT_1916414 [Artomyces pyxidatus]
MRSSIVILAAVAATLSPAIAAPVRVARDESSLLEELLGATDESIENVLKNSAADGIAAGGVTTAGAELEKYFGKKGKSQDQTPPQTPPQSTRRELEDPSLLEQLLGATDASIENVVKTSAANGLASGGVVTIGALLEEAFKHKSSTNATAPATPPSKRNEAEEELIEEGLSPLTKGILGTLTGLGVSSAIQPAVDGVKSLFGSKSSDKRNEAELEEEAVEVLEKEFSPLTKGIIGTVTGLATSSVVQPVVDGAESLFGHNSTSTRRDVTPKELLARLILRAFDELD